MTRLYEARATWRHTISLVICVAAGFWGVWELWNAYATPGHETGYLFGAAFIGGGIYGVRQVMGDNANRVVTLDRDDATGATKVTLWRPLGMMTLEGDKNALSNWRYYVKLVGRFGRAHFIYADHASYPRQLEFELREGIPHDGLKAIAPDAVADFEEAVGIKKPA